MTAYEFMFRGHVTPRAIVQTLFNGCTLPHNFTTFTSVVLFLYRPES